MCFTCFIYSVIKFHNILLSLKKFIPLFYIILSKIASLLQLSTIFFNFYIDNIFNLEYISIRFGKNWVSVFYSVNPRFILIFKGDEQMIKFVLCDDNIQVLSKLKEMLEKIFIKYDYRSHNSVYCIHIRRII